MRDPERHTRPSRQSIIIDVFIFVMFCTVDGSLWIAELSLPPSIFSIKYSLRMTPKNGCTAIPSAPDQPHADNVLVLDGNWLVMKFPGEAPIHYPFGKFKLIIHLESSCSLSLGKFMWFISLVNSCSLPISL